MLDRQFFKCKHELLERRFAIFHLFHGLADSMKDISFIPCDIHFTQ